MIKEFTAGEKIEAGNAVFVKNGKVYNWMPGAITPIYVKWRWLDRRLCKLFNPFKKI